MKFLRTVLAGFALSFASAPNLLAADWTNSGGNAERNGMTSETGPSTAQVLWSGGRSSIIAWQPVTEGHRVFLVRQTSFPPESTGSPVVCQDLDTGTELWATNIPANSGDWTTWVAGVNGGHVYASRSGNGASVSAKLYCLDAATGATLWMSADSIDAGAYDGVVFAPNGDPVVASFRSIWRVNHLDGSRVWVASRVGSVSGNCGGAVHGNGVFVADAVAGGEAIKKFDLATGSFLYAGPVMPGFTLQNTPMVGPDGTVYLSRTQNNASVDFFYAFTDTGSALTSKWNVPAGWSTSSELAVGTDGSVYHVAPGNEIHKLDPATGGTLATTGPIPADFSAPRIGVDALGRVFLNNGAFSNGTFYSFNPDLTSRWSISVPSANIGSPAIGADGTLVIAGVGTSVTAYRTAGAASPFCFGDGTGAACPCGNSGVAGRGRVVAAVAGGALLAASGTPSLSADTLALASSSERSAAFSIFLQGNAMVAPALYGDGLRCVGGTLKRLFSHNAPGGSVTAPQSGDPSISARSSAHGDPLSAGDTRYYQVYYRDPSPTFCPNPPGNTWNISNGLSVTWAP
jgi:hypothetical protein